MTEHSAASGHWLAVLMLIASAISPCTVMADTYETSWTVPQWRIQADVGLTPLWIYDASGLFYSGFQVRTMQEPDIKLAMGLGGGLQFGVRWNRMRGVGFTLKGNMGGRSAFGSAFFATLHVNQSPGRAPSRGNVGIRLGWTYGWEKPGVGHSFALSAASGCVHGPAVNDNIESGESGGAFSNLSFLTEVGVPIRFGRDNSLRIMPILAQEFTRPVLLGYEEFLGVEVPITAHWNVTLGISLSYSQNN